MLKQATYHVTLLAAIVGASGSAIAQRGSDQIDISPEIGTQQYSPITTTTVTNVRSGHLSNFGNGELGQRQRPGTAVSGQLPIDRLQGRVANRVQNRIRNRIDRFYSPQANATDPFRIASEQVRTSGRTSGR